MKLIRLALFWNRRPWNSGSSGRRRSHRWQVERDPFCRSVLERHWPNAKRFDDVRTVGAHNLEPVDVICGGFPARISATPGKVWVWRVKDRGFGTNSLALLAKWDRDSLSWKTSQRSFLAESETFSARFPTSGMMHNGELFELPTSARPHRRERIFVVAYARRGNVQLVGERGIVRGAAARIAATGINGTAWERRWESR